MYDVRIYQDSRAWNLFNNLNPFSFNFWLVSRFQVLHRRRCFWKFLFQSSCFTGPANSQVQHRRVTNFSDDDSIKFAACQSLNAILPRVEYSHQREGLWGLTHSCALFYISLCSSWCETTTKHKLAKNCFLTGQKQACPRITRLLVRLSSPCRKWPQKNSFWLPPSDHT